MKVSQRKKSEFLKALDFGFYLHFTFQWIYLNTLYSIHRGFKIPDLTRSSKSTFQLKPASSAFIRLFNPSAKESKNFVRFPFRFLISA